MPQRKQALALDPGDVILRDYGNGDEEFPVLGVRMPKVLRGRCVQAYTSGGVTVFAFTPYEFVRIR